MAKVPHAELIEERSADLGGYRQELKRTLGPFQVFAISFAFISVAVGIFGTYDDVLRTRGAHRDLAVGHRGGRADARGAGDSAVRGAHRAYRLLLPMGLTAGQPKDRLGVRLAELLLPRDRRGGGDNALASQAFMPLVGLEPDERTARLITLIVLLVQAVLTIASTRIVGILNSCAVGVEVVIVGVLVIALVDRGGNHGTGLGRQPHLARRHRGRRQLFRVGGGLMLAMIMGLSTLVGFEAAANLAEEAKDPYRSVPRAIVGSVVAAAVLGLLFLIALTVAIPNVTRISRSGSPVAAILRDQLGPLVETALLVVVTFAFFACGMVVMTTGARLVFAMSRDGRFPAHRLMRRVHPRTQTPIPATILIFAGGVALMVALPGEALLELITASTILPVLIYAATVVLYLAVRERLDRRRARSTSGASSCRSRSSRWSGWSWRRLCW